MGCSESKANGNAQKFNGKILLYGSTQSPHTQMVLTTLLEKQLDFQLIMIDIAKGEQKHEDFINEKHPFGFVPVLIDSDGYRIFESRAICRYLELKYKGKGNELIPNDDVQSETRFEQAASIETSYFYPPASGLLSEVVFKKILKNEQGNGEFIDEFKKQLNDRLDVYDQILSTQNYLAGENFTLVDLFHLPFGSWLIKIGEDQLFNSRVNVSRWWTTISSRDSWKSVQAMISTSVQ